MDPSSSPETPLPAEPSDSIAPAPASLPEEEEPPTSLEKGVAEVADPTPEASSEGENAPIAPVEPLALPALLEISRQRRLNANEEASAKEQLAAMIKAGKAGLADSIEPLIDFPWIIGAGAVSAAWPDLSLPMRRWLLASLARHDNEAARRLRMSLARALFKIDPPAGLKLAAAVSAKLKDEESGHLGNRSRQVFFNVLIGKGKPWLLQFPLADLKAAEANALIFAAIETFPLCPPISQLSILRWINEAGRLKKLPEASLATVVKSVSRWNLRWQRQLRKEIEELPASIVEVFKPEPPEEPVPAPKTKEAPGAEPSNPQEVGVAPEGVTATVEGIGETGELFPEERGNAEADGEEREAAPRGREPRVSRREERRLARDEQRAAREEQRAARQNKPFDFKESLRGLEQYVGSLRQELEQTKAQVRKLDEGPRRRGRERVQAPGGEEFPVDIDAVQKHNAQLEQTVQLLRQQLEELTLHHESIAESRNLHSEEPLPEGSREQLVSLLTIKLNEYYQTYEAMKLDPLDRVFRLDYRDLLGSVFDILREQGVTLVKEEEPV